MGHQWSIRAARLELVLAGAAALLALSGCTGGSGADLFSVLPLVFGNAPDSQDSFAELVQDSDLVVIGRVTGVTVDPIDTVTPAVGFVTGRYKISITVTPTGGGDAVTYAEGLDTAPELAKSTIRDIEGATLPESEMLFALREVDDWGYACTSAEPRLCPIEWTPAGFVSPRFVEGDPLFPGVVDTGGLNLVDYVRTLDPSVEVR